MNSRLNLPLYEMTNRAYEVMDSLRKVISSSCRKAAAAREKNFHPVEKPPRLAGRFFTLKKGYRN